MLESFLREAANSFCFTEGAKEITRICKPWLDTHGFSNFYYISLTRTGDLVFLTSQVDYAMNYWAEGLPTRTGWNEADAQEQNYSIVWNSSNLDKNILDFSTSSHCYDGFTLANRYHNVIEAVTFFRKAPLDNAAHYYLKQKEVMRSWTTDFQLKYRNLIRHAKEHPMRLPQAYFASETKTFYPDRAVEVRYRGIAASVTFRELDCLSLHAKGFTWPHIAAILNLSLRTVETHFASIKNRFGLTSRDDLSHLAMVNAKVQTYTPLYSL